MSIVDEIRSERNRRLDEDKKDKLLQALKQRLIYDSRAIIAGGSHFPNPKWDFNGRIEIPYSMRPAVKEFLESNGFYVRDYINSFGVNYGLEVYI